MKWKVAGLRAANIYGFLLVFFVFCSETCQRLWKMGAQPVSPAMNSLAVAGICPEKSVRKNP